MRLAEVQKMERNKVAYNILLCKLAFYKEQLERVTLVRKHNERGTLISCIVCYLTDKGGTMHTEKYRLYNDDYLWFITALEQDFPEIPFEDLTREEDGMVEANV